MISWRGTLIGVIVGALVAALAATAIAGPGSALKAMTKSQVKKIATKQANARINALAPGLAVARAETAGSADTAADAASLGGKPANAYAEAASEPFHLVGTSGEPAFLNGWSNFDPSTASASFMKDSLGAVHLRGAIQVNAAGNSAPVFVLPPSYRPSKPVIVPIAPLSVGTTGRLEIDAGGNVKAWCMESPGCTISIDASFVAGS